MRLKHECVNKVSIAIASFVRLIGPGRPKLICLRIAQGGVSLQPLVRLLADLKKKRLAGSLITDQTIDMFEKILEWTAPGALAAGASLVNTRIRNIFNGLLLVQLMPKFPH